MSRGVETELPQARYSYGGDEFVFVELAEAMSLKVNFRAMAITNKLEEEGIEGVMDICPSNASYMVRIDPDVLHPDDLISRLKEIDDEVGDIQGFELHTRVVDVPVMMEDPWTHETLMRFRDRHQDPDATDLEYSARINGYDSQGGLYRGAARLAVARDHDRVRAWPAVVLPARPAGGAGRGPQVREAPHLHPRAGLRLRRRVRGRLLRRRSRRLPALRPRPCARPRREAGA